MNLLTKTTLYYITVSLFIFFIGGISIYKFVKSFEDNKVHKELNDHKLRLLHSLENKHISADELSVASGGLVSVSKLDSLIEAPERLVDTLILDELTNNIIPFRCLEFHTSIDGKAYKVSICKPMTELNYLVEQIALIVTIITIFFLLVVYFLYRYFFAKVWSDFFDTTEKIQNFNPASPERVEFPQSMIIEFNELNSVLSKMIDRINSDFQGLRDFSGNLSHEIQTPLAVIKSKTNLLIQDANISEKQMLLAGAITKETNKISRFIKALALFSKLDYHRFPDSENLGIKNIVEDILNDFEDFIENKNLSVEIETLENLRVEMNKELCNILFTNLIKNAVRHNIENGKIKITIAQNSFTITNTGCKLNCDANMLFDRFIKHKHNSASLGIGLSIVKKICDYYSFGIQYKNDDKLHVITLDFSK